MVDHVGVRFSEELLCELLGLPGNVVISGVSYDHDNRAVKFYLAILGGGPERTLEGATPFYTLNEIVSMVEHAT